MPDEAGRLSTLRVHTRGLTLAPDVSLQRIAAATPTFSGAELAALTNEAAIRSVRRSVEKVMAADAEGAAAASENDMEGRVRSGGMAAVSPQGANTITMADFNSALVDFVSSRRRGVGGILGKVLG